MKKYVTQCPHCNTRFRVVPDHIRISEGLVRCGHCREVFDARPHLTEWSPPASPAPHAKSAAQVLAAPKLPKSTVTRPPVKEAVPAAPALPALPVLPDSDATDLARAPLPPDLSPDVADGATPPPPSQAEKKADGLPVVAQGAHPPPTSVAVVSAPEFDVDTAPVPLEPPLPPPETAAVVLAPPPPEQVTTAPDAAPVSALDAAPVSHAAPILDVVEAPLAPPEPEVSFVRQARRDAFWRQTWVRLLLGTLLLGLLAGLAGQLAVHERDRIAAIKPELRPWLAQLCQPLGCEIKLLKQIQAVQIDSSALTDLKNGAYRFEVTLVNTAPYPVAVPAVELAITNADGQVVASKVVLPSDWPASPEQLTPRTEHPLQTHLMFQKPEEWPMSGYRALVFYP